MLCLLAAAAFAEEPAAAKPSPLLMQHYRQIMTDVFELMKSDRRMPPTISDAEIKEKVETTVENLKKLKFFDATGEQEKKFQAGTFDDLQNTERMAEMIKYLKGTKIEMPAPTVYAMTEFNAARLKAAPLEVCKRLVELNVTKLKNVLGGQK